MHKFALGLMYQNGHKSIAPKSQNIETTQASIDRELNHDNIHVHMHMHKQKQIKKNEKENPNLTMLNFRRKI